MIQYQITLRCNSCGNLHKVTLTTPLIERKAIQMAASALADERGHHATAAVAIKRTPVTNDRAASLVVSL